MQQARIKNWTARLSAEEYMAKIREALSQAGAVKIRFERASRNGPVIALSFEKLGDTYLSRFRIAPDGERVRRRVMESKGRVSMTQAVQNQAYKTMWANVCDFVVVAQALVELGSHHFEQVFFPFLLSEGEAKKTYFEVFEESRALPMAGASTASPVTIVQGEVP